MKTAEAPTPLNDVSNGSSFFVEEVPMKRKNNYIIRTFFYVCGFLIMTMGIAISVKSGLGVSPVSSIPYTITCVFGIEMGKATVIFHVILVAAQILLLRKAFKLKNLLQIPAGILFGMFTTFCNSLMDFFPTPENLAVKLIMMLISTVLIAFGIFFYVPADFIPLAGEGMMLAVSQVTKIKFSTVKLIFDISMVIISLITCLAVLHSLGSVGIGTVIAAVLVGSVLKVITKYLGKTRDRILYKGNEIEESTPLSLIMKKDVYTINSNATIKEALAYLTEKKISGAPILNAEGDMVGFISDGDILRWLSSEQSLFIYSDNTQETFNKNVSALMDMSVVKIGRKQVISVDYNADMTKVCSVLSAEHLKKVPVVNEGRLVGIINASNITRYILGRV
jgi:uncharacterized membrane protein YczE/CBS domain-containing protein